MKSIKVNAVSRRLTNNLFDLFAGVTLKATCRTFNGKEYFAYDYSYNGKTFWFCYSTDYWHTFEAIFVEE